MKSWKKLVIGLDFVDDRPGGLGRSVDALCKAYDEMDLTFHRCETGRWNVKISRVGPRSNLLKRMLWFAWNAFINRKKFDYIEGHFALHSLIIFIISRRPMFTYFHGPWAQESQVAENNSRLVQKIKFLIEKYVYRRSEKIFCASHLFKDILLTRYVIDANKIHVIPLAVDSDIFYPVDQMIARKSLGVEEDKTILIAVRRLTNRMGLDLLIEAMSIVIQTNRKIKLFIIGNGEELQKLQSLVNKREIHDFVQFEQNVASESLPIWYSAADFSVMPSRELEGFGLVILESMSCGTPVIISKYTGMGELLGETFESWVVDCSNLANLADAINKFTSINVKKMQRYEILQFASTFNWRDVARNIQKEIELVLHTR